MTSTNLAKGDAKPEEEVPRPADPYALVYKAHGKWAFANGQEIESTDRGIKLGTGVECDGFLKKGSLNGREFAYITKMWNTWAPMQGFFREIYLYANSKLLRPLQGDVVPYFIGVYDAPGGRVGFAMDLPHPVRWKIADTFIPQYMKEKIIAAFQKLHDRGIGHGDVALRHMLIGEDESIKIIDFGRAFCLEPNAAVGLPGCNKHSLRREMRKVKFCLDYNGAKMVELARAAIEKGIETRNKWRCVITEKAEAKQNRGEFKQDWEREQWIRNKISKYSVTNLDKEELPEDLKQSPAFMRDEFTALEVPEDFKAEWIEVPDSHRFPLHPADIYHHTPAASSEASKDRIEGLTSEYGSESTGGRVQRGKSGKLVKFGPDTMENEHKVPLQRPVIPKNVPPREGSDKADRDPNSPEPDLPGIDPPSSSPPPELRKAADPLGGSHGTTRTSSISTDLKSNPDTNNRGAAETTQNGSKVVVSSSPPRFYVPASSVPRKPHVTASPGAKSNHEIAMDLSVPSSTILNKPNRQLEQAYIACLDVIKSEMKFDDETVDILDRLKVRGKKEMAFLGTVDEINIRVKYHLGQPSHCSVKIDHPNNSAEKNDSALATALKPPIPLPKVKRLRDGETAGDEDCEASGGSTKKARHG